MTANYRIEKQPDGSFTWKCPMEVNYYKDRMRPGFYFCLASVVFIMIFGGIIAFMYHDLKSFFVVAGAAAVVLLISVVMFGLAFSAEAPEESFHMTDEYMKTGSGKTAVYFDYKKVQLASVTRKYVDLHGGHKWMRVFFPEEDMDFICGFIMEHLPDTAEIRDMRD